MEHKGKLGTEGDYDFSADIVDGRVVVKVELGYSLNELKNGLILKAKAGVSSFINKKLAAEPDMNVIERKMFESVRDLVASADLSKVVASADAPAPAPVVEAAVVAEGPAPVV